MTDKTSMQACAPITGDLLQDVIAHLEARNADKWRKSSEALVERLRAAQPEAAIGMDELIKASKQFKPSICGPDWYAGYVSGRLDGSTASALIVQVDDFPARIVGLLQEISAGPFEDDNGDSLTDDAKAALAWLSRATPPAAQEDAVGVLCVEHFRGASSMENLEYQPLRDLPPGQHYLFTHQGVKQQPWQPIETAPEDGEFLVYMPEERTRIQSAKFRQNVKTIGGAFAFDLTKPSHWMPLPPPPAITGPKP